MVRLAVNVDRICMAMNEAIDVMDDGGWVRDLTYGMCMLTLMSGICMMGDSILIGMLVAIVGQVIIVVSMIIITMILICMWVIIRCVNP
jgi:hypothetical protein